MPDSAPAQATRQGRVTDAPTAAVLAAREADRILLTKFVPAAVLINDELQILQFRGQPGPYIRPLSGTASLNVLKMVHPSVSPSLHRALRSRNGIVKPSSGSVSMDVDGQSLDVFFEVLPVRVPQQATGYALVVFHAQPPAAGRQAGTPPNKPSRDTVQRLRRELSVARDHLQSVMSEHDAANDALRAALQSGTSTNEDLQSTNEELETAKEELQSTNEELNTVNDELQARNLDLNRLNNDLVHVLASIDLPVLTLGSDGRIRRFNQAAERLLHLLPSDVGRLLADVRTGLHGVDLSALVSGVIKNGRSRDVSLSSRDDIPYVMRARPYPSGAAKVDGVVLTWAHNRKVGTPRTRTISGRPGKVRDATSAEDTRSASAARIAKKRPIR